MTRVAVTHRFGSSADRVYNAWLDPATMRKFLYTTATGEIVRCEVDARVGGKYTIVDRRNGEDVLHEGTYLEFERPRRIVFTVRVPKYSPDEDRVTIEITPLAAGCDLTLTTQTSDEWAGDTQRGWTMILDVLNEILPTEIPTCGAGLAQHGAVPRRVAIYLAELAETLELHRGMLVLSDANSRRRTTYTETWRRATATSQPDCERPPTACLPRANSPWAPTTRASGPTRTSRLLRGLCTSKSRSLRCCALRQGATRRCSHRCERSLSEVSLSRRSRRSHPSSDDASLQDIELANTVILPVGSTAPPAMLQSGTVSESRTVR